MYKVNNSYSKSATYIRYPSYLMYVVPPRVYSSVDVRNMLVPKTYGLRKVSSVVMNHSRRLDVMSSKSSVEFKDVNSTIQNVNEVNTRNSETDTNQKNDIKFERVTDITDNLTSVNDIQTTDDELQLIKVCKKCHKVWSYDDFLWDQQVKTQMIKTIRQLSPEY